VIHFNKQNTTHNMHTKPVLLLQVSVNSETTR